MTSVDPVHRTDRLLVVFAKAPVPGEVKTRLGREIGMEAAAAIYRDIGRDIVDRLRGGPYRTVVAFTPARASELVRSWLDTDDLQLWPQVDGDLGARMHGAFIRAFGSAERVCLVGTDVPRLSRSHVETAFDELERHDAVFGPAADGGYYLVALNRPARALFEGIAWSSPRVLEESVARARASHLTTATLDVLSDLDRARDLEGHPELRLRHRSADP